MTKVHKLKFEDPNIIVFPDWFPICKTKYPKAWVTGSKMWKYVTCKKCLQLRKVENVPTQ